MTLRDQIANSHSYFNRKSGLRMNTVLMSYSGYHALMDELMLISDVGERKMISSFDEVGGLKIFGMSVFRSQDLKDDYRLLWMPEHD